MSLLNAPLFQKNRFLLPKARPRKAISRSPFKLSGQTIARELGPQCQSVDAYIGNQRMLLDLETGHWISEETDETAIDPSDMTVLKERKRALEKENNILQTKLEILLEMLAETTAETTLQFTSNK